MVKFSKGEAVKFGWEVMKGNLGFFIKVLLVVFLIAGGPQIVGSMLKGKEIPVGLNIGLFLVGIVCWILQFIVNFGLIRISLKFVDGQKPEFSDLFSTQNVFKYIKGGILYFLIIVGGFILLVIPAVIWGIKYQFYQFFIAAEPDISATRAIKESGRVTEGAKWDLFVFGLIIGLINLAGLLALGIGLFATIPATMVASAYVFRKLQTGAQIVPGVKSPVP
ncbi:MAG: DUF975 family protein [bacterium]|nr:DUF975 family protein [bacterium]